MKTKEWLERNKIFFETLAAILLSIMAFSVSCSQRNIAKNQLALSVDPQVLIEPSVRVKGNIGEFKLTINNHSLVGLYNIRIYEDYFVTKTLENKTIQLNQLGVFSILPNKTIQKLESYEKSTFIVNCKPILEQMKNFYKNQKGLQMRIIRLIIKYQRKLDGKEYKKIKAYLIAGHGDTLIDSDERGINTPHMISFNDIKNIFGIT